MADQKKKKKSTFPVYARNEKVRGSTTTKTTGRRCNGEVMSNHTIAGSIDSKSVRNTIPT